MQIEVRNKPDCRIVDIDGDVNFNNSNQLLKQLTSAADGVKGTFAVNLTKVKFMDSSGIATMLEALKLARSKSVKFALIGMNENLRNVFVLSRLDKVFTMVSDESALS